MLSEETQKQICKYYKYQNNIEKYSVCNMGIELTRRCNLNCLHCSKGDPQDIDIDNVYIDSLFEQIAIVHNLSLAGGEITLATDRLRYVLDSVKRHNVLIEKVYIVTNAVITSEEVLEVWNDFLKYVKDPKECKILISSDKYHKRSSKMTETEFKKTLSVLSTRKKRICSIARCSKKSEKYL